MRRTLDGLVPAKQPSWGMQQSKNATRCRCVISKVINLKTGDTVWRNGFSPSVIKMLTPWQAGLTYTKERAEDV